MSKCQPEKPGYYWYFHEDYERDGIQIALFDVGWYIPGVEHSVKTPTHWLEVGQKPSLP